MNKKYYKKNLGFTLIEMLLYMGLLSLLLLLFTNLFASIIETQLSSESVSFVSSDGRTIYSRLVYDINRAESISIPANVGDTTETLAIQINGTSYQYGLLGGNLMITEASISAALNSYATKISGLTFKRIGNIGGKHTVQIHFTVSGVSSIGGVLESQQFQTTVGLR